VILVVDNYDSFTYNLVHMLEELGGNVIVRRNDAPGLEQLEPTHLVLSPGPGRPPERIVELVRRTRARTLGVCLGHQAIVQAFGGEIGRAQRLVHGKASPVEHDGRGIFEGLPAGFDAGRYHSLAATAIPECLEISARGDDEVMAVRHRELPVDGVQFHPESVLTPHGRDLLRNFLSQPSVRWGADGAAGPEGTV
jgi:para-aminobenzoate synthetase component 2